MEAVTYTGQRLAMRQRTYSVLSNVKTAHRFAPMVTHPSDTHDGHPGINWEAFHTVGQRAHFRGQVLGETFNWRRPTWHNLSRP